MTDYRVYRFDGGSQVEMAEWFQASDDDDAIQRTRRLGSQAAMCELWRGNRLIMSFGPQDVSQ